MPAANFGHSDYITLGYLISPSELENDSSYMEEVHDRAMEIFEDNNPDWNLDDEGELLPESEQEEPDLTDIINDIIFDDIDSTYEDAFYTAESVIEQANFRFIEIDIESGYYEGAWLKIQMDYTLEDESDREDLYQDIAKCGEILLELADMGWRSCSSHCYAGTHRAEYTETVEDIANAIKEMMQEAQEADVHDWDDPANDWEE